MESREQLSVRPALLLASLLLFTPFLCSASTEEPMYAQIDNPPHDMRHDENGKAYIMTDAGEKFLVYLDRETDKTFFLSTQTQEPQWDDPRLPKPVVEPASAPPAAPKTTQEKLSLAVVATIPALIFIGAVMGRIYYLHTHYPELLFPTKERKDRRRASSGKFKPQKARGKMSQDGKGGRSANS